MLIKKAHLAYGQWANKSRNGKNKRGATEGRPFIREKNMLHEPDNFVGIIDSKGTMLQFMVEDYGNICVDAPMHDQKDCCRTQKQYHQR